MPSITRSADVAARPTSIFWYLREGEHVAEWLPDVVRSERLTPGPVVPGSRFRYVFRVLGRDFEIVNEITAVEPPKLIRFESVTGVSNRGQFDICSPDGSGLSRVTLWFAFDLPGGPIGVVARRLPITSIVDHYAQTSLTRLVRRLESLEPDPTTEQA